MKETGENRMTVNFRFLVDVTIFIAHLSFDYNIIYTFYSKSVATFRIYGTYTFRMILPPLVIKIAENRRLSYLLIAYGISLKWRLTEIFSN